MVGVALGAAVRTWKIRMLLAALAALVLLYVFNHVPSGPDDDDNPRVLVAIAMMTNFGGWVIGLGIGGAVARVRRSSAGSSESQA